MEPVSKVFPAKAQKARVYAEAKVKQPGFEGGEYMAAYRFAEPQVDAQELPPLCAQECIWYERNANSSACANRHENICRHHRREIFRSQEAEPNLT
jgi:hypothetical protein